MKTVLLVIIALVTVFTANDAEARRRQYYSASPEPSFYDSSTGQAYSAAPQYTPPREGDGRLYPGRESYGRDFGSMPRHPGDYRDALDRGTWQPDPDAGSKGFYGW